MVHGVSTCSINLSSKTDKVWSRVPLQAIPEVGNALVWGSAIDDYQRPGFDKLVKVSAINMT